MDLGELWLFGHIQRGLFLQLLTNNKGFFVGVFLGEVRGGRIGGGGCVRCRVLCWFWAEGAHWCLAGALRFWVAMCVRRGQVRSYLF